MLLGRVIIYAIKAVIKKSKSTFASQTPISWTRHVIDLVMFFASLIYSTLITKMILLFDKVQQVGQLNIIVILFSGDIIFVASFFVLGSKFISKLKSNI